MTLKLAIWDLDGTLIDSRRRIQRTMEVAFEEAGIEPPSYDQTRQIVGLQLDEAIRRLAPNSSVFEQEAIIENYKSAFVRLRHDSSVPEPLYEGAQDLLHDLVDKGWLMGVATGKSRRGVDSIFERHDLGQFFDAHFCADDGPGKPHPHMIHANMDKLGCFAGQTVMIGDAIFDMQMARAAKVKAIGVSWGFGEAHEIEQAGAHEVHHDFISLKATLDAFEPAENA